MKNALCIFTLLLCSSFVIAKKTTGPKPGRAENTKIVLGNLAHMIGHIGDIIDNPTDTETVGNSVANIVDNIVRITMNAVQNKSITIDDTDAIIESIHFLCEKIDTSNAERAIASTRRLIIDNNDVE